ARSRTPATARAPRRSRWRPTRWRSRARGERRASRARSRPGSARTVSHRRSDRRTGAVAVVLALATLIPYAQTWTFGFIDYDDPDYVTMNPYVRAANSFVPARSGELPCRRRTGVIGRARGR